MPRRDRFGPSLGYLIHYFSGDALAEDGGPDQGDGDLGGEDGQLA
jgi:hypothetical protein